MRFTNHNIAASQHIELASAQNTTYLWMNQKKNFTTKSSLFSHPNIFYSMNLAIRASFLQISVHIRTYNMQQRTKCERKNLQKTGWMCGGICMISRPKKCVCTMEGGRERTKRSSTSNFHCVRTRRLHHPMA